jgi:peptidoglycan hydrolase-like protein with peptidoglycan-binding domain
MIRFIALAALAVLINVTSALAQPVLTNGGFEQSPPNNYGNNISWSIAPWVLTSGSANVVTVDGPGGQTWYGNNGPASDATGGTGNFQHYLDQADTSGTIYQEFTPLCTGEVRYGAFFSTRGNAGGYAEVSIKDATGSNVIAGPASVTVPGGNSENDPWQLASFTATLTAGTTYRFEIDMDNQLNMDNAYVAFGPECTEHSSPDWSDPDDETDPIPDPDPVPLQCTPFTQEDASCDATTGEITVTLDNALTGTFDPNDLGVECLTPGVTVVQNPFNPLELIITGASAGQTVMISTSAVQDGAGNGAGLDLCCTGEVEILIPEDMICDAPVDVSIDKVWNDAILHEDQSISPHGFEITVDLELGSLSPGDVITVDDPASGQINVTAFGTPVAPAGWSCSISAGSWSCQYVVPSTGAILPATIIYPSIIDGSAHVLNCASVSVATANGTNPDTDPSNNSGCWETNAPNPETPTLELVKTGPAICDIDAPCDFTVTFTNTGTEAYTGNVLLQDQTTVSGFDVTNVSPMPAGCGGNLPANPFACVIALNNFAAGASQTYTITMAPNFPGGQVVASSGENCADVVSVPDSITPGDYSWNYYQDGEAAMPSGYADLLEFGQPVAQSCVQYSTENTSDELGELSVEKICERQPSLGSSVFFICGITVSSTGPITGTVDLNDYFSYDSFNGDSNSLVGQLTSSDPWTCATAPYSTSNTPQCSISGADLLAAGGTSTLTSVVVVQGQDLGETDIVNCAQIVNGAAEPEPSCVQISEDTSDDTGQTGDSNDDPETPEFNVFKDCDNNFTPVEGTDQLTVNCSVQVTPLTPFTGTLTIDDSATNTAGGGQASFVSVTGYDTNVWACTTNANPVGFNCGVSGANYPVDGNGSPVTTTFNTVLNVDNTGADTGSRVGWNNCANGIYASSTGQFVSASGYCDQIVYDNPQCTPVPEIPDDMIDNDCDGEVDETTSSRQSVDTVPELTLTKSPLGDCIVNEQSQTYSCDFALTVENAGSEPFDGPLNLLDAFGSPSPRNVGGITGDGWQCLTASGVDEVSCLAPDMPLEAGASTTVEMSLTLPGARNGSAFENCVSFALPNNSVLQAKILQTLLNDMGIDVGTVDGAVGPNTLAGIAEFQRQEGLPETGEVSEELLQALGLNAPAGEQTCVSVNLPPMPEPPLTCDPSTTVLIDGACECRFSRMMQTSVSSCSCISGTEFDAGRGCIRPERQVSEPRRPSAPSSTPSTPRCPAGSTFNAARGECVAPVSRPSCGANQFELNGSCRCVRGYILRSGTCRRESSENDNP